MVGIIDQQIQHHFGEKYDETLRRTRNYIAATLRNYQRWGKLDSVLDNEGGRTGVLRNCLLTIIEVGDINNGLHRWSERLAKEYVNAPHLKWDSLFTFTDGQGEGSEKRQLAVNNEFRQYSTFMADEVIGEGDERGGSPVLAGSPEPPERPTPYDVGDNQINTILKTSEELDLYTVLANGSSLREAADLTGIPYAHAKRLNNRVWQRARRHRGKRGYSLAAKNQKTIS